MPRKPQSDSIEPTPPSEVAKREQQLLDDAKPSYKANQNGWVRRGNPTWSKGEGRGPPKKEIKTRSQHLLKAMGAVQIVNLAHSAMAKYGYDGQGTGGAEGYMTMLAQRFPLQFMTDILAKMIPTNIDASVTNQIDVSLKYESAEHARADIGQLAVPLDILLERDDPPLLEAPTKSGNGQG
jgi:hypothetical protein